MTAEIKNPTIKTLVQKLDQELENLQQETNADKLKLIHLKEEHHNFSTMTVILLGVLTLLTLITRLINLNNIDIFSLGTSILLISWWAYNTINYTLKIKEGDNKIIALKDLENRINNIKILTTENKENGQDQT